MVTGRRRRARRGARAGRPVARCSGCRDQIRWTVTVHNRRMPVDYGPSSDGFIRLLPLESSEEDPRSVQLRDRELELAREAGELLWLPHQVTCARPPAPAPPRPRADVD